jgi:hypothetical protein
MTVSELIEELSRLPQDAEVEARYVGSEYNSDFEIFGARVEDEKWSLSQGKYLKITPRVILT